MSPYRSPSALARLPPPAPWLALGRRVRALTALALLSRPLAASRWIETHERVAIEHALARAHPG